MVALLAVSQGVVSALHAPFAVQVVGATAEAYAALLALQGAGGIAGAWLVARIDVPARTVLTAGLVLGGALTVVYASVPLYWVLAAVALVEGVLFSAVFIAIPTLVQRSIPPDRLGRAFAGLDATENAGMLAGTLAGGALAAVTTVQAACLVAGIGFATAGALAVKKEDRPWTTAS